MVPGYLTQRARSVGAKRFSAIDLNYMSLRWSDAVSGWLLDL